ncbi:MAG TPA: hypothetical protein VGP93_03510 [Polyangiaceae bacterium]|nr:hypothetical protein [Polyangiaceae bacterium]
MQRRRDGTRLIVLGHAASEEAGMRRVDWLARAHTDLPLHFIPAGSSFTII